ncbi:hypothetical protein BRADI_4g14285v3 [Brachypodium distachyon]|uniref:F-box domain-containing protein n=1 Tax=Brachypodium distachyon TaxID=15368 RepID=A0A0Q3ENU7_BRADI|nr:hypothetical protein BRADI_4g14285v3 [Brachypodium distachyon]
MDHPASKRSKAAVPVLPPDDVTWEILLRLPVKSLCRFRATCRSWRSLLSDPAFIREYAFQRPGFVLAVSSADGDRINIVHQCQSPEGAAAGLSLHPGPLYLFESANNRVHVVSPDAGAMSALPVDELDGPTTQAWAGDEDTASYTLGRASQRKERCEQLCHVLTLSDSAGRWRPSPAPPFCVTTYLGQAQSVAIHSVVVRGVVYFLPDEYHPTFDFDPDPPPDFDANRVASFDLETEDWMPATIPGPRPIDTDRDTCLLFKLAELNSSLIVFHQDRTHRTVLDLWFMEDLEEEGVWVKKHSIQAKHLDGSKLLRVLDDGRMVFSYRGNRMIFNYEDGNCLI